MTRRLSKAIICAICAEERRVFHRDQITCSRTCGAIWRAKHYPQHHTMVAANAKRRQEQRAKLAEELQAMTLIEAYKAGYTRGYRAHAQRIVRQERRRA